MAANAQVYSDAGCTTELSIVNNNYELSLGPDFGLDGTVGEVYVKSIWVKNTGDRTIKVILEEVLDAATRGSYSLDGNTYNATTINLGYMETTGGTQIVRVYLKLTVAEGTAAESDTALNFKIKIIHL